LFLLIALQSASTYTHISEERCGVNKWGAPNKKQDASSNTDSENERYSIDANL
jgi:hypothetical protein